MTKYLLILISLFWITNSLYSQNREFVLNAELHTPETNNNQSVYLYKIDYNSPSMTQLVDSTIVVDGKFSFKSNASDKPEMRVIEIGNSMGESGNFHGFFIAEPGIISMIIDSVASVKGSSENQKHQELQDNFFTHYRQFAELQQEYESLTSSSTIDEVAIKELSEKAQDLWAEVNDIIFDYAKSNMSNGVGEFYFISYAQRLSDKQSKELYLLADSTFKESQMAKMVLQSLGWGNEKLIEGQVFKGIELITLNGKSENFDNLIGEGKVILIDFWASWCGPCRKEMPKLTALYEKYKDKGFDIIGVSLDNDEASWQAGVSSMSMKWPQFSDLSGWNGVIVSTYGITHIPQTFLLDGNGTIIARDLKGENLEAKIIELLAN